jgi:hypothetical protein
MHLAKARLNVPEEPGTVSAGSAVCAVYGHAAVLLRRLLQQRNAVRFLQHPAE